jgi:hypothetical protein
MKCAGRVRWLPLDRLASPVRQIPTPPPHRIRQFIYVSLWHVFCSRFLIMLTALEYLAERVSCNRREHTRLDLLRRLLVQSERPDRRSSGAGSDPAGHVGRPAQDVMADRPSAEFRAFNMDPRRT